MDYQRIYNTIIERGKKRNLLEYAEEHHIVPRCLGGTDDANNLVNLTAEEHYVCHQLLVKIHPDNIGLVRAAMFMSAGHIVGPKRNNKTYGWLKRRFSDYMKGPNNPQKLNPRSGDRHHYYGKGRPPSEEWLTEEGREILSNKMMGDKNPCSGLKPWKHPRATDYTKGIWSNADEIYKVWLHNDMPSYCRLLALTTTGNYKDSDYYTKVGPFMNIVKYFRSGWVPTKDLEWKELKETV